MAVKQWWTEEDVKRLMAATHPADEWDTSNETCPKCGRQHVEYRVYDGPGDSLYRYRCNDCQHSWMAEPDA